MTRKSRTFLSKSLRSRGPVVKGTFSIYANISVETRDFKRPSEQSPSNFVYHWNHNGETHFLVGEAMGKAMVTFLKK